MPLMSFMASLEVSMGKFIAAVGLLALVEIGWNFGIKPLPIPFYGVYALDSSPL